MRLLACLLGAWVIVCPSLLSKASVAPTPAEQKIALARAVIAQKKANAQTYNDLAKALASRARETADPKFYDQANEALAESFRLEPDNFEGLKTRVWVLLGKHDFARALREAKALNTRVPDDLTVYAMLVDAHVELGNYVEAENAAQWLLDLRPGNIPGLTRAAYLRELFGDLEGALDLMAQAYNRTDPQETEDRAWLLTHMAHLHRLNGQLGAADTTLKEALKLFPDYHYALGELAKVRTDQKRVSEAISLLRTRFAAAPHPENLFELGEALHRAGKRSEAKRAFSQFEKQAAAESDGPDNANRELVRYYVDYARNNRAALRLAQQEFARRQDVFTRDALAWALFSNRKTAEARAHMEKVLAVGVRDPLVLEHARRMGVKTVVPGS
jgi:tetratricopeptide (TPR) repeat protein